jgi:hypothetical protein
MGKTHGAGEMFHLFGPPMGVVLDREWTRMDANGWLVTSGFCFPGFVD